MEAAAQLMIEETNTAMINSATGAKLNLVHAQRDASGYRESRMSETLLHITNTDGQLDYIQALRNEKKADLVQFIVDNRVDTANLGGIAWLPQRAQFWGLGIGCYDCSLGFSVICAQVTMGVCGQVLFVNCSVRRLINRTNPCFLTLWQCMTNYVSAHEFGKSLPRKLHSIINHQVARNHSPYSNISTPLLSFVASHPIILGHNLVSGDTFLFSRSRSSSMQPVLSLLTKHIACLSYPHTGVLT